MWCIVPFKVQSRGKRRLAGVLSSRERAGLSMAMIEDLLIALKQVRAIEGILMVSDDTNAVLLAQKYCLDLIEEESSTGTGLNHAVNCAIGRLTSRGINDILVIHSDLPLVSPADISKLIQQHRRSGKRLLTLVPDRWHNGTNCMVSSSCAFSVCFGEDSLSRHQRAAEQYGVPLRIQEIPSVMFDIDTPVDLRELVRRLDTMDNGLAVNTRAFLETINRERLRGYTSPTFDSQDTVHDHEVLL